MPAANTTKKWFVNCTEHTWVVWPIPKNAPPYLLAAMKPGGIAELEVPGELEYLVFIKDHLARSMGISADTLRRVLRDKHSVWKDKSIFYGLAVFTGSQYSNLFKKPGFWIKQITTGEQEAVTVPGLSDKDITNIKAGKVHYLQNPPMKSYAEATAIY